MMNRIPVDQNRAGQFLALSVTPDTDDTGNQKRDRAEVPVWKIECLNRPLAVPGGHTPKAQVEIVKISAHQPPQVEEMAVVQFQNLTARPWNMATGSGVSLSADGIVTREAK